MFKFPTRCLALAGVAVALSLAAIPAQAASVAQELIGYRSVDVRLNETTAKDCFIETNQPDFTARLIDRLKAAGLEQTDQSGVAVVLNVSNKKFGLLGAECALHTNMTFQVLVPPQNLTGLAQGQQDAINRLGGLPVILWTASSMAVTTNAEPAGGGRSLNGRDTVLDMIDSMVGYLVRERQ